MSTQTYVNISLVTVDTAVNTALVNLTFKLFKFQIFPNKLNLLNAPHKKSHGVNFGLPGGHAIRRPLELHLVESKEYIHCEFRQFE